MDLAPWKLSGRFFDALAAPRDTLPVVRASLVNNDPLMTALGRPNREQVVTVRQATATTLQALELTNGATLAKLIRDGADKILAASPATPARALAESLYQQTLGRKPSSRELRAAENLLGAPVRREGIEDLLWALTMLPEFQLIY